MQAEQGFTYKPESHHKSEHVERKERTTFIMPFIVLSFLVLPSLAVLAISKPTAGFDVLVVMGYYQLIRTFLWVLVGAATVCGVLYMVRTTSVPSRILAGLLLLTVLAGFGYVLWPQ